MTDLKSMTLEELTAALKSEVTKLGAPESDTVVYEIQMLFSLELQ